ncbi:MAG: hypothetical protein HY313_09975 [Acidobacteria bacterium]|nr:hypothetical protein [Acidobacteriota bacterium]
MPLVISNAPVPGKKPQMVAAPKDETALAIELGFEEPSLARKSLVGERCQHR